MAPSAGAFPLFVATNMKILRLAFKSTNKFISVVARPTPQLPPVFAQASASQHVNPVAFLRQTRQWFPGSSGRVSAVRRFSSRPSRGTPCVKHNRAPYPKSRVASAINVSTARAPFASTLRPNLTGGVLGRSAGGYGLGSGRAGGVRYFSHTPAAQAQVVQNVNQAFRAFFLEGKIAQYDGTNPRSGEKRYKTVTSLQAKAMRNLSATSGVTPGSFIDFSINPTITALTQLGTVDKLRNAEREVDTLNSEGLLDILSIDFSRALKESAIILNDLKALSALGALPITYQDLCLRIHFPGCDAGIVENLINELGIRRGVVGQHEHFSDPHGSEFALKFPCAPTWSRPEFPSLETPTSHLNMGLDDIWWNDSAVDNQALPSPVQTISTAPGFSIPSGGSSEFDDVLENKPCSSSISGHESLLSSPSELEDWRKHFEQSLLRDSSERE